MRRSALLIAWLATDLALFVGAYTLAYFLRVGFIFSTDFPIDRYLTVVAAIAPTWIAILGFLGVFRLTRVQSTKRNMAYLLFAAILSLALFSLTYFFVFGHFFSRLLLVYAGVLSFAGSMLWHLAFDQWQRTVLRRDPPAYPMLIIGTNREAEAMIKLLNEQRAPFKPVAILDSRSTPLKEIAGVPVLGRLNKLEDVIKQHKITHLLQCTDLEHTINFLSLCRQHRMTYFLLPQVIGTAGFDESIENLEGRPVIAVKE